MNAFKIKSFSFFKLTFSIFFMLASFLQISKIDAIETSTHQQLAFGDLNSPIEVYFFTDWFCPICRALEPDLEKMAPAIMQKSKVIFVDFPIHPETKNYVPYNLALVTHNKDKYLELRAGLSALGLENKNPTKEQVAAMVAKQGDKFVPLSDAEIADDNKFSASLIAHFKVNSTPTVIVYNPQTKKHKKLVGGDEVTQENILKAIEELSAKA